MAWYHTPDNSLEVIAMEPPEDSLPVRPVDIHELIAKLERRHTHCSECGAPLFVAVPGQTTQEEILKFVLSATWTGGSEGQFAQDKWIHPGAYCPNCGPKGRFHF